MISVVTYLWRGKREFRPAYVNALARMVRQHLPEKHRFICVTDFTEEFAPEVEVIPMPKAAMAMSQIVTPEREHFPSSYPRLWTFSREARKVLGERVLLLDIDLVIIRDLRPLLKIDADFVGWNLRPPEGCPPRLGGGTWLHRPGTRTHVWEEFVANPQFAINAARNAGYRGSDQAWMSYQLKDEQRWPEPSGIYCAQDWLKPSTRKIRVPIYSMKLKRRLRGQFRWYYPELKVPGDAIILHWNGSSKPWDSQNMVAVQYWRPFADAS